jgi:hypothetical protein
VATDHARTGRLASLRWKRVALDALVVAGGVLSLLLIASTPLFTAEDWNAIKHGSELIVAGHSPYQEFLYRWSPFAAWLMVPVVLLPYWAWVVLHLGALLALSNPLLIVAGLISWPFWQDAGLGNVIVFVLLAAYWALRGNRLAIGVYLAMCVLMPRPLMLPVLVWLLWKRPATRPWFAAIALAGMGGALATGYGVQWFRVLLERSSSDIANPYQIGPSVLIGIAWLPIGAVLAAYLTWKGRLGLASLAASPYWLPYYLLMLLLDVPGKRIYNGAPRPSLASSATSRSASPIE